MAETLSKVGPKALLSSGHEIPLKGLGTFDGVNFEEVLHTAIDEGCRHIDTARVYKNEGALGPILTKLFESKKVSRGELFITTKVWNKLDSDVERDLEEALKDLQLEYVDLVLLHWPFGKFEQDTTNIQQWPLHVVWKKLENCVKRGLARSIGVSNFNTQLLVDLLSYAEIKPAVNQIEIHPYLVQKRLVAFCQQQKIHVTAYSSLCRGGSDARLVLGKVVDIFNDPVLKELAAKYNRSVSQLVLNWVLSRGISIIPKSSKVERVKENFRCDDFQISEEDTKRIESLDSGFRTIDPMYMKAFQVPLFD